MLDRLRQRVTAFFTRLFRRAPPAPGRFEEGSKFSARGIVGVAPWIWPRRDYLVYVPSGGSMWRRRTMLVLVHGCRQSAEDIAKGARITAFADANECLVLLPKQAPRANAWGCWNWFDRRTAAGGGETALLAAQIRSVRRRYRVHPKRVFAAGLSSGAGLVAVLALRNPRLLAGAFLHSGIAAGAAQSAMTALDVLKRGPDTDVVAIAREARKEQGANANAAPALVVQGLNDDVVAPVNAREIVRQVLAFADFAGVEPAPSPLPAPTTEHVATAVGGRNVKTSDWRRGERLVARLVEIDGLAHAWTGGDDSLKYFDAHAPVAADLLHAFIGDVRSVH